MLGRYLHYWTMVWSVAVTIANNAACALDAQLVRLVLPRFVHCAITSQLIAVIVVVNEKVDSWNFGGAFVRGAI